jgi:hypothetical protein
VNISGGYPQFVGFPVVTKKPLGSLVDRQSQDRRPKMEVQQYRTGLTDVSDRFDQGVPVWPVRSTGLTCVRRCSPETSKRWTHIGITRLASRLSKFAVARHPFDGAMKKFPKVPLGACILVLGFRGSFIFRLPPYNPSGERMAAISWYPSLFCFAIFLFLSSFGISRTILKA